MIETNGILKEYGWDILWKGFVHRRLYHDPGFIAVLGDLSRFTNVQLCWIRYLFRFCDINVISFSFSNIHMYIYDIIPNPPLQYVSIVEWELYIRCIYVYFFRKTNLKVNIRSIFYVLFLEVCISPDV